jgi:hypothetical protein
METEMLSSALADVSPDLSVARVPLSHIVHCELRLFFPMIVGRSALAASCCEYLN